MQIPSREHNSHLLERVPWSCWRVLTINPWPTIPRNAVSGSTYTLYFGYSPYNPYCSRSFMKWLPRRDAVSRNCTQDKMQDNSYTHCIKYFYRQDRYLYKLQSFLADITVTLSCFSFNKTLNFYDTKIYFHK